MHRAVNLVRTCRKALLVLTPLTLTACGTSGVHGTTKPKHPHVAIVAPRPRPTPPRVDQFTTLSAASEPAGMVLGPDGNLWFLESNASKIARMTPQGTITEFALPSPGYPYFDIVVGPDQ